MKYTALVLFVGAIGTACFAVFMSASGGPTDQTKAVSTGSLVLLFGFVAALLAAGVVMWKFGGKGYTVSEHPTVRSVGLVPPDRSNRN